MYINSSNEIIPLVLAILPCKSLKLSKKNLSTKHEKLFLNLLVRLVQETPKPIQAFAVALGCLPELESKTLLLKTQAVEDLSGSDLKASSLMTGYASLREENNKVAHGCNIYAPNDD